MNPVYQWNCAIYNPKEGRRATKPAILIVDDHPMFRQGIRQLLERNRDFEVVGEASNGEEAIKLASSAGTGCHCDGYRHA